MPIVKNLRSKPRTIAPQQNIEIKFCCANLGEIRKRARELGATPRGVLIQTDTYFHVPPADGSGARLKLRETGGDAALLIAYRRPNVTSSHQSDYRVVPVANPTALKAALTDALGVRSIVRKRRELLMYKNVRIHLDRVLNLGNFGELEAVIGKSLDNGLAASRKRIEQVVAALVIQAHDLLAGSYGEMIEKRKTPAVRKKRRRAL